MGKPVTGASDAVWFSLSPNKQRSARVDYWDGKRRVVIDGEEVTLADLVRPADHDGRDVAVLFSPDSSRTAFIGGWYLKTLGGEFAGESYAVWIDGKQQQAFDEISAIWFSADSRRLAYVARRDNTSLVVVEGLEGPAFDDVTEIAFHPRTSEVTYGARRGDQHLLIVNGKEIPADGPVVHIEFAPLGNSMLHVEQIGPQQEVFFDGVRLAGHDQVDGFAFSADESIVAYAARSGDQWEIRRNGEFVMGGLAEIPELRIVPGANEPTFNARRTDGWIVYDQGRISGPYRSVGPFSWTTAKAHTACYAWRDEHFVLITDGQERLEFEPRTASVQAGEDASDQDQALAIEFVLLAQPIFDESGERVLHVGTRQGKYLILLGDLEVAFGMDAVYSLTFAPGSGEVVYSGSMDDRLFFNIGGKTFEDSVVFQFSPDGAHVGWLRSRGEGEWTAMFDALESGPFAGDLYEYAAIFGQRSPIHFVADDRWFVLVTRDELIRIEARVVED